MTMNNASTQQNTHDHVIGDRAAALSLLERIPDCTVITDPDAMVRYGTDWTRRWSGRPAAVIRPQSFEAVVAALSLCNEYGLSVVPQGGNTGLVAGAVPPEDAIVLSTERLTCTGDVNSDRTVTIGAGITLAQLEALANRHGLSAGLTLASGESATVGGVAATNAGGARVLRYGTARARIAGLRAVTIDGTVIDRRRQLPKDNTGFDLTDLLIGSEGTLAVITDVTWRLARKNTERLVIVMAFADAAGAVDAVEVLRELPGLEALEWAAGRDIERVARHIQSPAPLPTDGFWVFAEMGDSHLPPTGADGSPTLLDSAEAVLDHLIPSLISEDRIAIGSTAAERRQLWLFRERMTEAINTEGVPVKLDVGVPLDVFAATFESIGPVVASTTSEVTAALFGHLAEGNFHINLLHTGGSGRIPDDLAHRLEDAVLELVLAAGGTVSAEHGIGRAKRRWLCRQHGAGQTQLMSTMKSAWDPHRLLNPGVLFDA